MGDRISIVIPVFNGADAMVELYQRLVMTLEEITNDFEMIMVDDYSRDDSYQQMLQLQKQDQRVKVIKLAENFGQQNALICGLNFTTGDYIVTIDDDLQHRPEDIPRLYHTIKEGYQVVYGIPADREYSFYRSLGSKMRNLLFTLTTAKKPEIQVSSFRIMTRELIEKVIEHQGAFVYISASILRQTDQIGNIAVAHHTRKHGHSNYNFIKLVRLFSKIYIYHGNFPMLKLFRSKKPQYIIEEKIGF